MKRLSLIDSSDKEQMLLRNPADYRSGFWVSYLIDSECIVAESTEELDIFPNPQKEIKDDVLNIILHHAPRQTKYPALRFSINIWSYNEPIMLIRHSTSNLMSSQVNDVKVYFFMDFDVGGPRSYKDDSGIYYPEKSLMTVWDETPLYVDLTSNPKPDGWEINSPVKLEISENYRDLQNNLSLGPKDVASALQWNLGNLTVGESKSIDIVLTAARSSEDAELLLSKAWELFDKKIR
jgi:hypothetical protein